jgi:integrase
MRLKKEYVYIISNPSYKDNYLKIGYTTNEPIHRISRLNQPSGIPTPFKIEFIIITENGYITEQEIHYHLNSYRVNKSREFFEIEINLLKKILEEKMNINLNNNDNDYFMSYNLLNIKKKNIDIKYRMTFNLKEYIKEKRPNLSAGSLATYTSILKNLYAKMNNGEKNDIDIKFFNNYEEILNFLKDIDPVKRKTTLSALVVISNDDIKHFYQQPMMIDIQAAKSISIEQKMTDKQKENWVSQAEVREKFDSLYDELKPKLASKKIDNKTLNDFSDLLLLALTSGLFIPPRRSLDWTEFKIKNINKKEDNYMLKGKFYFNKYKTAISYGMETIDIPTELQLLLKKYISYLPTSQEYLFINNKGGKYTSIKVAITLNKIFDGRNISINNLRHSFISEKYRNIPKLTEMIDTAKKMGHSLQTALEYIKHE